MGDIILGNFHIKGIFIKLDLGSDSTDPTSVCVNDTTTDSDAGLQTHFLRCFFTESTYELASSEIASVLFKGQLRHSGKVA